MSRATIHISVPEIMRKYVEARVSASGYGTVSEYFRQLIREDRQRQINIKSRLTRQTGSSLGPPSSGALRRG